MTCKMVLRLLRMLLQQVSHLQEPGRTQPLRRRRSPLPLFGQSRTTSSLPPSRRQALLQCLLLLMKGW